MSAERIPEWAGDGFEPHEFPAPNGAKLKRDRLKAWFAHQPLVHRALDVALVGMLPGVGAYARFVAPHSVEITDTSIPIRNLPPAFHGFRVVHFSDLHLGANMPVAYLRRCVQLANDCRPDLVAITGDFLQWDERYAEVVADVLADLKAPHGAIAVLGNHDYGLNSPAGERMMPGAPRALTRELEAVGIRVLRNDRERVEIGGDHLDVVGVEDLWSGSCDADRAFGPDEGSTRLFLCHNPDGYGYAARHRFDVMLAGHTHGAQVRLPRVQSPVMPLRDRRLTAGFYGNPGCWLFVTRGVGYIWKVRLNSAPEIGCHTLAHEEEAPSSNGSGGPFRRLRLRHRWRG